MAHETSFTHGGRARRNGSRSSRQNGQNQNVGATERVFSAMAGAGLALWGLRRGGLTGMAGVAAGAGLAARGISGYCPWYASMASQEEQRIAGREGWKRASAVTRTITIDRPKEEVYRLWRDFSNLPKFMQHIERIDVHSPQRSHWVVSAPGGTTVQWDSIVTEDRPGELIAWKSDEGADVRNTGRVEFHDAGGGRTEVRAVLAYEPPGGAIGQALASLLGQEPSIQAREDLHRFKQMIESGGGARPTMHTGESPLPTR